VHLVWQMKLVKLVSVCELLSVSLLIERSKAVCQLKAE
jgi:hypothetical protein